RAPAFARSDRAVEEPVHHRAGGTGLPRQSQRLADLSEDLALAQGQRIEPRRDAEKVARGVLPRPVEAGALELGLVEAAPLRDEPRQLRARSLVRGEAVDLAAVARRDDDPFRDHAAFAAVRQ